MAKYLTIRFLKQTLNKVKKVSAKQVYRMGSLRTSKEELIKLENRIFKYYLPPRTYGFISELSKGYGVIANNKGQVAVVKRNGRWYIRNLYVDTESFEAEKKLLISQINFLILILRRKK